MKLLLRFFGMIVLLMGLLWAGQGAGIIMWPESSFMLANDQWVGYGLLTAAVGAVMIWIGRRR